LRCSVVVVVVVTCGPTIYIVGDAVIHVVRYVVTDIPFPTLRYVVVSFALRVTFTRYLRCYVMGGDLLRSADFVLHVVTLPLPRYSTFTTFVICYVAYIRYVVVVHFRWCC